jgi:sugar lactone lactonase YvrE
MLWKLMAGGGLAAALLLGGCGSDNRSSSTSAAMPIVFNAENNRLHAYDPADGFRRQTVIFSHADDPLNGLDINGQICFARDGSRRFIAGEDTGQPNPPQGWGVFQLHGTRVGALSATRLNRLVPTYQQSLDNAENYGCGFLSDGRLLLTDVGDQAGGPPNGQLIIWFPPLDAANPHYCKLDIEIGTAGGIYVDAQDRVYVSSARVNPGIYRYSGPFPTSDTASGGCGRTDPTGKPLATAIHKEVFIGGSANIPTPSAIVASHHGTFYVSSVINGVIAEYDPTGKLLGRVLTHPPGETAPYSTGTPFGIGIDADGTLYYADIGVQIDLGGETGPGPNLGTVRRLRFVDGAPQAPEKMDQALNFPDGIGVLE